MADLNGFIEKRREDWKGLEDLLMEIDKRGLRGLELDEARRFAHLYRAVSSDLVRARSMTAARSVAKRTPSRWQWESMSIT